MIKFALGVIVGIVVGIAGLVAGVLILDVYLVNQDEVLS